MLIASVKPSIDRESVTPISVAGKCQHQFLHPSSSSPEFNPYFPGPSTTANKFGALLKGIAFVTGSLFAEMLYIRTEDDQRLTREGVRG